jgi:SAM-dependent methyltransferase
MTRPIDPYVETSYSLAWSGAPGTTFDRYADPAVRRRKALKIAAVLAEFTGRRLADLRCLDLGCGEGRIARVLAEQFGQVVGLDPDRPAIERARQAAPSPNLTFEDGTLGQVGGRIGQFDVVVCNHVYEHVHDHAALVAGIAGALGPSGCCYFAAGNALMLREGHYGLPFLSWLPGDLATAYLRLARRGSRYRERHLTLWGLRRLLRDFQIHDYTRRIIADPARYRGDDLLPRWLPPSTAALVASLAYPLVPTYVWVLTHAPATRASR